MLPPRSLVRGAAVVSIAVVALVQAQSLPPASTSSASYPRHIVLGRNGQVVAHADPSMYLFDRTKRAPVPLTHAPKTYENPPPQEERNTPPRYAPTREAPSASSKISITQVTTDSSVKHETPPAKAPVSAPVSHDTVEVVLVYTSVPGEGPGVIYTEHVELRGEHHHHHAGLFVSSHEVRLLVILWTAAACATPVRDCTCRDCLCYKGGRLRRVLQHAASPRSRRSGAAWTGLL